MNVGQLEELLAKVKDKTTPVCLRLDDPEEADGSLFNAFFVDITKTEKEKDAETGLAIYTKPMYCKGDSVLSFLEEGDTHFRRKVLFLRG